MLNKLKRSEAPPSLIELRGIFHFRLQSAGTAKVPDNPARQLGVYAINKIRKDAAKHSSSTQG
jgi:hypothetical protein